MKKLTTIYIIMFLVFPVFSLGKNETTKVEKWIEENNVKILDSWSIVNTSATSWEYSYYNDISNVFYEDLLQNEIIKEIILNFDKAIYFSTQYNAYVKRPICFWKFDSKLFIKPYGEKKIYVYSLNNKQFMKEIYIESMDLGFYWEKANVLLFPQTKKSVDLYYPETLEKKLTLDILDTDGINLTSIEAWYPFDSSKIITSNFNPDNWSIIIYDVFSKEFEIILDFSELSTFRTGIAQVKLVKNNTIQFLIFDKNIEYLCEYTW